MSNEILELCARPSFFEGMARLFDFPGILNCYNYSKTTGEADYRAILSDWRHVGNDLLSATMQYADMYLGRDDERVR
jgi:hypothetical protein